MTQEQFDRLTQYLISNGDVPAVSSQQIYEYAWSQGIRPLREKDLKPQGMVRSRRKEPAERMPGHRGRESNILRAMKRVCGFDSKIELDQHEMVEEELGAKGQKFHIFLLLL